MLKPVLQMITFHCERSQQFFLRTKSTDPQGWVFSVLVPEALARPQSSTPIYREWSENTLTVPLGSKFIPFNQLIYSSKSIFASE